MQNKSYYLFTGGKAATGKYLQDILEWNPALGQWKQVGKMKHGRGWHGMSVIQHKDFYKYCTKTFSAPLSNICEKVAFDIKIINNDCE